MQSGETSHNFAEAINTTGKVYVVFLDFAKASDGVSHIKIILERKVPSHTQKELND